MPGPAAVAVLLRRSRRDGVGAGCRTAPARHLGRRWYLVAFDVGRNDWRTFRVDRATPKPPAGPRFAAREIPGGDAAAFVARSVSGRWPVQGVVRVRAAAASDAMRGWLSYGRVEPVSDAECLLHVGGETMQDVVFMLGSLTVEYSVVSPASLADELLAAADRMRAAAQNR